MKKITFLLTAFLLLCLSGYSQIQVGNGTAISQFLPFSAGNQFSLSQSIYLASDINASGNITSLQWYYTGSGTLSKSQQLVVYMGTVPNTKTSFASKSDWIPFSGLTQVYSGGITTAGAPGWVTISFPTAFNYNGVDNLVVAVDENMAGNDGTNDRFQITAFTGARSLYATNSSSDVSTSSPPAANNTSVSVPNVIFGGISQTCSTPVYLSVSDVGASSATVSWTNPASANALLGIDYYLSNSNVPPTDSTDPTKSVPAGSSVQISGLDTGVTYYVWVRNNCGNGLHSYWSESTSFTTVCTSYTSLNESFDGVAAPKLPNCWSKIIRGPHVASYAPAVETMGSALISTPNSVKLFNSGIPLDVNEIMLVTPQLSNLNSHQYRLKFYAKQSVAAPMQVGTLSSNMADAVFTPLVGYDNMDMSTNMTEYTVDFSGYTGQDSYIGFRMGTPLTGSTALYYTTLLLDNIRWELIPACTDVANIQVPEETGETAKIVWDAGIGQTQTYKVAYGVASATDPDTLTQVDASTNEKLITGLTAKTAYKVWVRSVCHEGLGAWIGPVSFTTNCPTLSDINENFDGYTVQSQQLCCDVLPDCWTKIIRSKTDIINPTFVDVRTTSYIFGQIASLPNSIEMSPGNNSTATTEVILVTPPLSTLSMGTYRLKFVARQKAAITEASVTVGTLNAANDLGVFTPVQKVVISTTATEYIISFKGYHTSDRFIGIKLTSENTGSLLVHLDDIKWEFEPGCADVTEPAILETDTNSALVNWVSNGGEDAWQIAVGHPGDSDLTTLPITNTEDNPTMLTGLDSDTVYNVWIRSNCGGTYGSWIGPVSFRTTCKAATAFNENFDSTANGDLPSCWSRLIRGSQLNGFSTVGVDYKKAGSAFSGANYVLLNKADSLNDTDVILVSPNLSNIFAGNQRLVFYARRDPNGNPMKIKVGTMNGNIKYADFHDVTEISLTSALVKYTVPFTAKSGSDTFIGIKISSADGGPVYLDNIVWEQVPDCPEAANFSIKLTRATSASFTWDTPAGDVSWDVAVSPTIADPDKLEYKNTTTASVTIEGLTVSTPYLLWIRTVCASGNGAWTGPYYFKTDCELSNVLKEDVESATLPNLPSCWSKILRGGSLDPNATIVTTGTSVNSGSKSIMMRNNQSGTLDDIILVSPSLSTLSAGNHTLKFWALTNCPLQVGTLNNNTAYANMFLLADVVTTGNVFAEYVVPFTIYTEGDSYIGIRMNPSSKGSQIVYIDDISLDESRLSIDGFTTDKIGYYPNPVEDILTITNIENISAVAIYNVVGQQVISRFVDGNLAKIDMSELSQGTYMVKISTGNSFKTIKVLKL